MPEEIKRYSRNILNLLYRHFKLGHVGGYSILLALLVILAIIDTWRFLRAGYSIEPAVAFLTSDSQMYQIWISLPLILFLLVVIPIAIGVVRIRVGSLRTSYGVLGHRSTLLTAMNMTAAFLLPVFYILAKGMEFTSGAIGDPSSGSFDFSSYLLIGMVVVRFLSGGLLAWVVLGVLGNFLRLVFFGDLKSWKSDYRMRLNLADLDPELYPTKGRHHLNFAAGAMAPETKFTRREMRKLWSRHQSLLSHGPDATDALSGTWNECKSLISDLLGNENLTDKTIRLFNGTSRALETSIMEFEGERNVILSPYEHPTEEAVCRWLALNRCCAYRKLQFSMEDFSEPWLRQKAKIIEELGNALDEDKTNIFIVSEVCYCTGLVVKIEELIEDIRSRFSPIVVWFVIDGAHSVGNVLRPQAVAKSDVYIFGGNKWLMGPEPSGVVVKSHANGSAQSSYDCWMSHTPIASALVSPLFALYSGLKLIKYAGLEMLVTRSTNLRQILIERLSNKFDIIGLESGMEKTSISSMKPVRGRNWTVFSKDPLEQYLKSVHINALVIEDAVPWLRLTFPYFMDSQDLERACSLLRKVGQ